LTVVYGLVGTLVSGRLVDSARRDAKLALT
jgi:hypothetical protein